MQQAECDYRGSATSPPSMLMPQDLSAWRKAQREQLLARRMAVPAAEHRAWSAAITRRLLHSFATLRSKVVGGYWPYKGEFDARHAMRVWRDAGARLALPLVLEKRAPLQFRHWWPGAPMTRGVFDLPVPDGTELLLPQALLIPPVGFDARGFRLGYGGGYFDRTLAVLQPQPLKIGVAFEIARIATIHAQPHDIAMDYIVTEAGVHRVGAGGLQRLDDDWQAE